MPRDATRPSEAASAPSAPSLEDPPSGARARTLASLLETNVVPMATLHERYGPLLELVRAIIGVVPKCDEYLEIWPPAFRVYNMMVPSFLNLPFSLFGLGGAPVEVVGLGMYVASRAAECAYCSAHTCSFALRRGVSGEKIAGALTSTGATFTAPEAATMQVARALAQVPSTLRASERDELRKHFTEGEAEWIVAGISMMGFLNKWMDAIGVDLEPTTAAEVKGTIGPIWRGRSAGRRLDPDAQASPAPHADSLWTKLRVLPLVPFAIRKDKEWQRGMPARWPAIGAVLRDATGHDFPVLARLVHGRLIQSIGSILRESLDSSTTVVGLEIKVLAGVVFATVVDDASLGRDVRALTTKLGLDTARVEAVASFARTVDADPPASTARDRAVLVLAKGASPTPAVVDEECVVACLQGGLSAEGIVEIVTWLAVLQMLHRLGSYYEVTERTV